MGGDEVERGLQDAGGGVLCYLTNVEEYNERYYKKISKGASFQH